MESSVFKHMEDLNTLLKQQEKEDVISEEVYQILVDDIWQLDLRIPRDRNGESTNFPAFIRRSI